MEKLSKKGMKPKTQSGGIETGGPLKLLGTDSSEEALLAAMGISSYLPGERYRILDARDKLMRMKMKKNSDLATAKAIVGTCTDMCPEKERYRRVEEHAVSLFEKEFSSDNEPDPKLIVKEYSRSSADQEQPLPHELRPPEVLETTMNHLVCNIINHFKEDAGVGEWYDFIWNRTRAIRKDITQQDLCDLRCVSLVEKCARFHIHCAAVLCEEDTSTFEPKINNINLTKSLQTLKYLYHDLMVKEVTCKNEAEFRSYDVLLNLNEGDILRQIQQYPQAVRESSEVKFATKLFSALNSHNYIRFFRLVRQASYLPSCILHRYFAQVRKRALQTIVKSFCMPSHTGVYAMEELVRILAFEGEKEARRFCSWLGLYFDDDGNVVLDRNALVQPSNPPPVVRAITLIESKKGITSVGEIVHGGPLPPNPYYAYKPHNSFDADGRLKQESYDASDQTFLPNEPEAAFSFATAASRPEAAFSFAAATCMPEPAFSFAATYTQAGVVQQDFPFTSQPQAPIIFRVPSVEKEEIYEDDASLAPDHSEVTEEITTEVMHDAVDALLIRVASETILECFTYEKATKILATVTAEMNREIVEEVLEEEMEVIEQEKAYLERKHCQKIVTKQLTEEFLLHVLDTELMAAAQLVLKEEKQKVLETLSKDILGDIIEETVGKLAFAVASEIHQREEKRRIVLQLLRDRTDLARARLFFTRWRLICVRRRKLRTARKAFPPGPPLMLQKRRPKKSPYFSDSLLTANNKKQRVSKLIDSCLYATLIQQEVSWYPMDIISVIHQALVLRYQHSRTRVPRLLCWKLVVLYPIGKDHGINLLSRWATAKFSNSMDKIASQQFEMLRIEHDPKRNVAVSVVGVTEELDWPTAQTKVRASRLLNGLSAIALLFQIPESTVQLKEELSKARLQLSHVLRAKPPSPAVGLQVFLMSPKENVILSEEFLCGPLGLNLYELLAVDLLTSFQLKWLSDVESIEANFELEEGLLWLANNSPVEPNLKSSYLKDFIEDGLQVFVFNPMYSISPAYVRVPEAIISLYNAAVKHLALVVSKPELYLLSWPIPELCKFYNDNGFTFANWNGAGKLGSLNKAVKNLQLPEYPLNSLFSPESIEDLWTFVEAVVGDQDPTVFSRVHQLLHQASESQNPEFIPWINLLCVIMQHQITTLKCQESNGSETVVHYFQEDLMDFHLPLDWVDSTRESKYQDAYAETNDSTTSSKRKLEVSVEEEPSTKFLCWSTIESDQTKDLSQNLHLSLLNEKEEAKNFISKLENILLEGSPFQSPPAEQKNYESHEDETVYTETSTAFAGTKSIDDSLRLLWSRIANQKEANVLYKNRLKQLLEM